MCIKESVRCLVTISTTYSSTQDGYGVMIWLLYKSGESSPWLQISSVILPSSWLLAKFKLDRLVKLPISGGMEKVPLRNKVKLGVLF